MSTGAYLVLCNVLTDDMWCTTYQLIHRNRCCQVTYVCILYRLVVCAVLAVVAEFELPDRQSVLFWL